MSDLGKVDLLDGSKVSEKTEGNSEENVGKVLKNLKKAHQVHKKIQQIKKEDAKKAAILEFLVKNVDNDNILGLILNFYKKSQDNIYFVFLILFPFLKNGVDNDVLKNIIFNFGLDRYDYSKVNSSILDYVDFVKQMYKKINKIDLDEDVLAELIMRVLVKYKVGKIGNINFSNKKQKEQFLSELYEGIKKEISNFIS